MTKLVIAVYRPKPGREKDLLKVVEEHLPILQSQGLVTERRPVVMRSSDRAIIEIFEWKSADAIKQAHKNPAVLELWERFSEVCDYELPVNVKEFHNLFSEFDPVN
jgi:hypothetical protein